MKISNYKQITLIIVIKNKTKKISCPQTIFRLSKHFNIVTQKINLLVFGLRCIRSNAETIINVIAIINEIGNITISILTEDKKIESLFLAIYAMKVKMIYDLTCSIIFTNFLAC